MRYLVAACAVLLVAGDAKSNELPVSPEKIQQAVARHEEAPLQAARDLLLETTDEGNNGSGLELYTLAYLDWRLSQFYSVRDVPDQKKKANKKQRDKYLKEAESILKKGTKDDPSDVESFSLLGAVYGSRITGMWSGMRLGPRADKALKKAKQIDASNPRVAFQIGASALYKPGAFGGGSDKAIAALTEAIELFEKQNEPGLGDTSAAWPNWGLVDSWIYLGQAHAKEGDIGLARNAYQKALELVPHYKWVEEELLPALDSDS